MTCEIQVVGSNQALDCGFLSFKICEDHVDVWESDCVDCGWWFRVVKFILFSSALFISYLITRDNAKVGGEVSCPHATVTRNFTMQFSRSKSRPWTPKNVTWYWQARYPCIDPTFGEGTVSLIHFPTPPLLWSLFKSQQGLNPPNCK